MTLRYLIPFMAASMASNLFAQAEPAIPPQDLQAVHQKYLQSATPSEKSHAAAQLAELLATPNHAKPQWTIAAELFEEAAQNDADPIENQLLQLFRQLSTSNFTNLCLGLGKVAGKEKASHSLRWLVRWSHSQDRRLASCALHGLGEAASQGNGMALNAILSRTANPINQPGKTAYLALERTARQNHDALQALHAAANNPEPTIARAGLLHLANIIPFWEGSGFEIVLRRLDDTNPQIRNAAWQALGQLSGNNWSPATQHLVQLNSFNRPLSQLPQEFFIAIEYAASSSQADFVTLINPLLNSTETFRAAQCYKAVGRSAANGSQANLERLLSAARNSNEQIRSHAIAGLLFPAQNGNIRALTALLSALGDSKEYNQNAAATILASATAEGTPAAIDAFISALVNPENQPVRNILLARIQTPTLWDDPNALAAPLVFAQHRNEELRSIGLSILTSAAAEGKHNATLALVELTRHTNADVRDAALVSIRELAENGSFLAFSRLVELQEKTNPSKNSQILLNLAQHAALEPQDSIPILIRNSQSGPLPIRRNALNGLIPYAAQNEPRAIQTLKNALDDQEQTLAATATSALAKAAARGGEQAMDILIERATANNTKESDDALKVLGVLAAGGLQKARHILLNASSSNRSSTRLIVVEGLKPLLISGDVDALAILQAMEHDDDPAVREAAKVTLLQTQPN